MFKALIAFATVVPLAGCMVMDSLQGGPTVKGSGKAKTETRAVGKFTRVAVQGSADCEITVGQGQSVLVTTDDNLLSHLKTTVRGDTLYVENKGSSSTRIGFKVKITVPDLTGYDVAGSGDAHITGLKGGAFVAAIAGSGDITATGSVNRVEASISGSGDIDLRGVKAREAEVSIAGSGDIAVSASEKLDASIAGSGNVTYYGNPTVSKSVVGSGEIARG